jgi:hypothetical protein
LGVVAELFAFDVVFALFEFDEDDLVDEGLGEADLEVDGVGVGDGDFVGFVGGVTGATLMETVFFPGSTALSPVASAEKTTLPLFGSRMMVTWNERLITVGPTSDSVHTSLLRPQLFDVTTPSFPARTVRETLPSTCVFAETVTFTSTLSPGCTVAFDVLTAVRSSFTGGVPLEGGALVFSVPEAVGVGEEPSRANARAGTAAAARMDAVPRPTTSGPRTARERTVLHLHLASSAIPRPSTGGVTGTGLP